MSDDTPTQPFDPAGDDAPTQKFEAPAATVPLEVAEERKSRRLVIILASIGGALLVAVLILLIVLLTRPGAPTTPTASPTASPSPTASASQSASPTPTPTETTPAPPPPPPPSTDAAVDGFTVSSTTVDCTGVSTVPITLIWSTSNATKVLFGIDSPGNDATNGAFFSDIAPSGNSDTDFPPGYSPFDYTCGNGSHTYVITAVNDDNGTKDSVAITVTG